MGKLVTLLREIALFKEDTKKLTEETPSPFMTEKLREKMGQAAVKASEFIGYEGAGTVEFLVDKNRDFYFMEMNTRYKLNTL